MFNNIKNKIRYKSLQLLKPQLIITSDFYLKDKNGKLKKHFFKVADSMVGNFLQILYIAFSQSNETDYQVSSFNGATSNDTAKQTNGAVSNIGQNQNYFRLHPLAGDVTYGIVFGTGSTTPTALDFNIETLIPNGTGAGQLSYAPQGAVQSPQNAGLTTSFILNRSASNNSGSPIIVSEVGIIINESTFSKKFLIFRDLVSPAVTVQNLETLTAQITFAVTT